MKIVAALVGLAVVAGLISVVVFTQESKKQVARQQDALQPFYTPPTSLPSTTPGTLIRSEPLAAKIKGGTGYRILYVSEQGGGATSVSSGMVFVPSAPAPPGGRPVLAWAHGTLGQGDACVPSRTPKPTSGVPWVSQALAAGWVVTATDYSGLGTPGPTGYLIGKDEAFDVLNSVRAASQLKGATTGKQLLLYGHSQGGHAALWTASEASNYAPEFQLVAAVAAAPAAELVDLVHLQWNTPIGWAIAPDIMVDWPSAFPKLQPNQVLSEVGKKNVDRIANECIADAAIEGLIRTAVFQQQLFDVDPSTKPEWVAAMDSQIPPYSTVPTLIAQGTGDTVILPGTTASYLAAGCKAGAPLSQMWLGCVNHMLLGKIVGPTAILWLQQRLAGVANTPNCELAPPVSPYKR